MMPVSTISISPLSEADIPGAVDAIQVSNGGPVLRPYHIVMCPAKQQPMADTAERKHLPMTHTTCGSTMIVRRCVVVS